MIKKILMSLLCLLVLYTSFSQSSIAKLKFEDAEEAYSKGNYETAIVKLEEAEKLLGSTNPKILHLKVLSQSGLLDQDPYQSFSLLERTRKNCSTYLTENENKEAIEDKYKEVYRISEKLSAYPTNIDDFEARKKTYKEQQAIKDAKKKEMETLEAKKKNSPAYAKNICEKYKFKPGLSLSEFTSYNADAANLARKKRTYYNGVSWFSSTSALSSPYPQGASGLYMNNKSNTELVTGYSYNFAAGKDAAAVKKAFADFKNEIMASVYESYLKITDESITIKVPNENINISVNIWNYNKWYAAGITFGE